MFTHPCSLLLLPALAAAWDASFLCHDAAARLRFDRSRLAPVKPIDEDVVGGWGRGDVIIATIKPSSARSVSLARPAQVDLLVHEVLRGDVKGDRSRSTWRISPHPRCGYGIDPRSVALAHASWPLPLPGEKVILWGEFEKTDKGETFVVDPALVYPFYAERLKWTVTLLRDIETRRKEIAARLAGDLKAKQAALAAWRASVDAGEIARGCERAELVGLGKLVSEDGPTFGVQEIVKGRSLRDFGGAVYYVEVPVPKQLLMLLDRETTYAIFLHKGALRPGRAAVTYALVGPGLIIADEDCRRALLGAVKK